ncbi:hypothetical protein GCM10027046_07450 [Uliginosibacterium flavum]
MIAVAVLAVLLAIAVPSFTGQVRAGRAMMASEGLARTVANARAIASQTGRRTTLSINGPVTDCGDAAAWAITQGATVLGCLTKADFGSKYEGASFSGDAGKTIVFLPNGVANNAEALSYTFKSGDITRTVTINVGGTVKVI